MQTCQRLQILRLGPAPNQDPGPDPTPGLTLEAAPAQDPENVATGKTSFYFFLCFIHNTQYIFFGLALNDGYLNIQSMHYRALYNS